MKQAIITFSKHAIIALILCIAIFIYISRSIFNNTVEFQSDEFYWIQSGRILPYILQGRFASPYWREHMGYTNFNGAKWVYSVGLGFFGHTYFEELGVPPETYNKWSSFDGSPFPSNHVHYELLKHGRLISAFMATVAVGLLFLLSFYLTGKRSISILSVLFFMSHPIFQKIALHAYADSVFIVGELCLYICIFYFLRTYSIQKHIYPFVVLGIFLGFTISTKVNAYMFIPPVLGLIVYQNFRKRLSNSESLIRYLIVCGVLIIIFLLLNPNIFFFKSYTLLQMIEDRIQITKLHMNYFHEVNPNHVLDTLPRRIHSLLIHVFTKPLIIGFFLTALSLLLTKNRRHYSYIFLMLIGHALYIFFALILYVVFDESRYFLPILPFICIAASLWVGSLIHTSETTGRN